MSLALGVDDLEEHARAIEELVHTQAPRRAPGSSPQLALKLPELAHVPPRSVPTRRRARTSSAPGDDVDLDALPILTCWPDDGGPFITLPKVITRDPETRRPQRRLYRMQKLDRRTTAMHWQIHKTGARHFRRAKELGLRRLEVAVALGGDPALTYAATAPLPDGIDEWMFAGFLREARGRDRARARRSTSRSRPTPTSSSRATSTRRKTLVDEGPFGDHTGYYTPVESFPRFHVTAITHRADAVYPATLVGPPPMEDAWLGKATERLFLPLLRMLFPEVVDMNLPVEGAFHNLVLVSIKKQYPFHAARLAHGLWGAGQMSFSKVICVVDDDVDVQDVGQVAWRLLANLDPKRDLVVRRRPDRPARPRRQPGALGRQGVHRRHAEVARGGLHARVARAVPDERRGRRARVDALWAELGHRRGGGRASASRALERRRERRSRAQSRASLEAARELLGRAPCRDRAPDRRRPRAPRRGGRPRHRGARHVRAHRADLRPR